MKKPIITIISHIKGVMTEKRILLGTRRRVTKRDCCKLLGFRISELGHISLLENKRITQPERTYSRFNNIGKLSVWSPRRETVKITLYGWGNTIDEDEDEDEEFY